MSEDTPQHPRGITLELVFRQGQRILGELGQIREKQDEIVTRLARVEREVVDLRRVPERRSLNRGDQPFGLPQPNSVAPVLTTLLNSSRAPG
jgi:hypothetical protein